MKYFTSFIVVLSLIFNGCTIESGDKQHNHQREESVSTWDEVLGKQIKLLGHRNWIVVVDAAYPLQSSPGITTVASNEGLFETIEKLIRIINR